MKTGFIFESANMIFILHKLGNERNRRRKSRSSLINSNLTKHTCNFIYDYRTLSNSEKPFSSLTVSHHSFTLCVDCSASFHYRNLPPFFLFWFSLTLYLTLNFFSRFISVKCRGWRDLDGIPLAMRTIFDTHTHTHTKTQAKGETKIVFSATNRTDPVSLPLMNTESHSFGANDSHPLWQCVCVLCGKACCASPSRRLATPHHRIIDSRRPRSIHGTCPTTG